jgi:hypothetical protein
MAEFVFTSPGAKFRERDLTFVTRNVGITTLGVVGETLKGPAFEPIYIQDQTQFMNRFGAQSVARFPDTGQLQYQLPYTANAYLNESNQMWVTRILGLSGYDAGKAWAVTLSAGVDPSTEGVSGFTTGVTPFTGRIYLGVAIYATGQTGTTFTGYTKAAYPSVIFRGYKHQFRVLTLTTGGTGTVNDKVSILTGTSYSQYENMVLAIVRSRGYVLDQINAAPITVFDTSSLVITGNTTITGSGDMFGQFTLTASKPSGTTEHYTVSLNPNASSFISNVLGNLPKDKKTKVWVQATYPDLIKKLDAEGYGYGINTVLIDCNSSLFTDYKTTPSKNFGFKTPETPWVVSQLKGNKVSRLFKFVSISDGDAANQEIKISIANINPITMEFDVLVRAFYDTDANPNILETYSRVNLLKGTNNYIAQAIGTTDGEYDLQSQYIMVEMDSEEHQDSFPAGFEGLWLNDFTTGATKTTSGQAGKTPAIFYKTKYNSNERIARVYLGLSPSGYDSLNGSVIGTGINQNFFNFDGYNNASPPASGYTKTKGFHMDSGATGTYYDGLEYVGQFEVGDGSFEGIPDVVNPLNPYYLLASRKFTLAPAGGFDGWNVNRGSRSYGDLYSQQGIYRGSNNPLLPATNDFQAWETAINTFANPEQVTINVFATPGINWSDQNILVLDTINMVTTQRTDTLYIIDAPQTSIQSFVGDQGKADVLAAQDVVGLLDTAAIDSNYACTYFPWIQLRDTQNNVNVYLPPTGEVVKAMAFTDNTAFPWFAPAGLNRGVTDARKSQYKMSLEARDILYQGRINPMADFADAGTAIFGQKTLQVRESALNRINVRRLLLQLKVLIANIAIRLVFEQNDQTTIDQFLSKSTPVLDTIKRERGLYDFRIKMDDSINTPETIDRNELFGEIFIKPTRAVEYIGITFTITPTGASFADVGA